MSIKGPTVGGRCTICQNQGRFEAEHAVQVQGIPIARAARMIGVNRLALARHMANHVAPLEQPEEADGQPLAIDGPGAEVMDAIGAQLAAMLKGKVSTTQRLQILAEQRRLAVDRARVVGPPKTDVVRVQDVEGLPELLEEMHEALKPWPEARAAIGEVYRLHREGKLPARR